MLSVPYDLLPPGVTVADFIASVDSLPEDKLRRLYSLVKQFKAERAREECQQSFLAFVRSMWPAFIDGAHLRIMGNAFERIANGSLKRLMIHMPPRHSKSEMGSVYLPAWYLGRFPDRKVIECSNTAELAVGFGRRVRNAVLSEDYQKTFPGIVLSKDSKAAGRWNTNKGGEYFAIGAGGTVAGKGADLLVIDDPHSEQEAALAAANPDIYDRVYEWYTSGPRQRLQPDAAIVIIATRWSKRDLPGRILRAALLEQGVDVEDDEEEGFHASEGGIGGEKWEVIEFPAILPSGNALWPQFWKLEQLESTRNSLPLGKWLAQYQQQPTTDEGSLVKREWWRIWEADEPPACEYIIQAWDTAYTASNQADYTACTTWGVFYRQTEVGEKRQANIILIDAFRRRVEFPELKKLALEQWKKRQPDSFLVEAKASGLPLIQEFRAMGIPAVAFTPTNTSMRNSLLTGMGDKFVRVNYVADLFSSGFVWCPPRRFAEEVVEELAEFPNGEHDDYVDSTTLALRRFRQGGFIALPTDEVLKPKPPVEGEYY